MKHDPVGGGEACGGFFCSPENELGIFHVNMCEIFCRVFSDSKALFL